MYIHSIKTNMYIISTKQRSIIISGKQSVKVTNNSVKTNMPMYLLLSIVIEVLWTLACFLGHCP